MKKVKIILIGSGKPEDPYRVPLPTYRMIDVDYINKVATVEVPDEYFTKTVVKQDGTVEEIEQDTINVDKLKRMYRRVWHNYEQYENLIKKAMKQKQVIK